MHKYVLTAINIVAATFMTALSVKLAWASAMQRAISSDDKLLLVEFGVAMALSVHLLPVLLQRLHPAMLWPLWLVCLTLAGYGHATWFRLSAEAAAEVRVAESAPVRAAVAERKAIEQTLDSIKARPTAQVAAQLARTVDPIRRASLETELTEARRAAELRDRLVFLSRNSTGTADERMGTSDSRSGTTWEQVSIPVTSFASALVLEVVGALLWRAVFASTDREGNLSPEQQLPVQKLVQHSVATIPPRMSDLKPRAYRINAVIATQSVAALQAVVGKDAQSLAALESILVNTPTKMCFRTSDTIAYEAMRRVIPSEPQGMGHVLTVRPPSTLQAGECYYVFGHKWGRYRYKLHEQPKKVEDREQASAREAQ